MKKLSFGKSLLIGPLLAASVFSGTALADDCGEIPSDIPTIPAGNTLTEANIREARTAVVTFSAKVDTYITCMTNQGALVLPYMTEKQRDRREEDLDNLHEKRRILQNTMNEAIRSFRRAGRDK